MKARVTGGVFTVTDADGDTATATPRSDHGANAPTASATAVGRGG